MQVLQSNCFFRVDLIRIWTNENRKSFMIHLVDRACSPRLEMTRDFNFYIGSFIFVGTSRRELLPARKELW